MTLRTKTLTAFAALTISATGFALAQDGSTTTVPMQQPGEAQAAPEGSTTFVATPAEESATADAAESQPADGNATGDEPATESAADEFADEQATPEPTEEAEAVTAAEEAAPAGTDAETTGEETSAEAPVVAEQPAAEAEAEAEAEEHAAEGGHEGGHIEDISFSFEGPFGKYDQFQLQRGLQVYTEVCAACHGMKFVPIRALADDGGPALPEDQVRAYAANFDITDPETDEDRPRLPTDHFPTVTGDGMGPDLSLMAKARAGFHGPYGTGISQLFKGIGGPEYIHAILTSYTGETKEEAGSTFYENTAFSTGWIKMPPPLSDDLVTYEDGTPVTVDQMSRDMSAFLMWTAEPKMMDRKMVGLVAVLFLIVLTALLYLTNKRLWAPHKGKHPDS